MLQLCVAIPKPGSEKAFSRWDERSAGAWRKHVQVHYLTDDKTTNDGMVVGLASSAHTLVLAYKDRTSADATRHLANVKRLKAYQLNEAVEDWLETNDLNWRGRTKRHCQKTPFKCISADEWVSQFAKFDPAIGRKAGAALLAQFRVVGTAEFAKYFSDLPEVDLSTYFVGADPHSGDYALIQVLAANIDNGELRESKQLPQLKKSAKVRLFCDGSWSGGETKRRIRCMFTKCDKKENALTPTQTLDVRVGFITDIAESAINRELQDLCTLGAVQRGYVRVSAPENNRLQLTGFYTGEKGLAFHDIDILNYVNDDPKYLQRLCRSIGEQVLPEKPLGTNNLASCIAFSHSLPAAMLPLFIVDGTQVTGSDGEKFAWKALLRSQHVSTGQDDAPEYHCVRCPLADRAPKTAQTLAANQDGHLAAGVASP